MSRAPSPLSRRAALRGAGAVIALPLLEAFSPPEPVEAEPPIRFVGLEMPHGAAGSAEIGRRRSLWSPATGGADFTFTPALQALEPLRPYVTIVSNTELRAATSFSPAEEDGPAVDHARSSAAFLTAAHPLRSAAGRVQAARSVDQVCAVRLNGATRVPSLQLGLEDPASVDDLEWPAGYAPAYRQAISWSDAASPLVPEHRASLAFRTLFAPGTGPSGPTGASVLDAVRADTRALRARLGRGDARTLDHYLARIRALEQRIAANGVRSAGGDPPAFSDQLAVMGELIALAFLGDVTRVATVKLAMDRSPRIFAESGVAAPFHALSHHREEPEKIEAFNRLNAYHVAEVARWLTGLRDTPEGGSNLLERSAVLYGSPMGDSHVHGHSFLPVFVAGRAGGRMAGGRHLVCEPGTPLANLHLTLLDRLGAPVGRFGDSTGRLDL